MSLPATLRPPKDERELAWQKQNCSRIDPSLRGPCPPDRSETEAPKTIVLPFYPGGANNVSKYVEVTSNAFHGPVLSTMRIRKAKPIIPGWLIELKDQHLRGVMDIKAILEELDERVDINIVVKSLCQVISGDMGIPIKDAEIFQILKRIPMTCDGCFSFPHFLYGTANPDLARAKGVFMLVRRRYDDETEARFKLKGRNAKCYCWDVANDSHCGGDRKGCEGGNEEEEENDEGCLKPAPDEESEINTADETGYSLREKVFFSGLLIFEMYDTLKQVETLYRLGKIPESARKEEERNRKRGYGIEDIGKRDFRKAAWDKPLLPLPKTSPYVSSIPFVTTRWEITEPCPCDKVKRSSSKLQPLHLAIRPPRDGNDNICIIENQSRVRQALAYLAAKGDCVALLPDIHFVIHLSDTAFDKLEIVKVKKTKCPAPLRPDRVKVGDGLVEQARRLYRPYRLPCQITKLSSKIAYTDGLQLRDICNHMQKQHWVYISQRKLDFREFVWSRMFVDQMALGLARDSFIYAFVTYLPYVSHLPIIRDNPFPV